MPRFPGPTLRRRKLVKELVAARNAARMSQRELATEMDLQPGTISKIEQGQQGLTMRNIRAIGRATGLSQNRIDELLRLAANDENGYDWLVEFRHEMPEWFQLYPALEQESEHISTYSAELVDGLLQTPAYTEAIARAAIVDLTEDQLHRSVELRKARQAMLEDENPPELHVILNEAAVVRPVGGEAVMREQIQHLIDMAKKPTITLQILPFSAGAHPGMKTGFNLLRFPEGYDDMDCVYLEHDNGGLWQERPQDVLRYTKVFNAQRSLALSPRNTITRLTSLV